MRFTWDSEKEGVKRRKHGVGFPEAGTVFEDTLASMAADPDHSEGAARYLTFGVSAQGPTLVVAHTNESDTIRIISSRLITRRERQPMNPQDKDELRPEYSGELNRSGARGRYAER